MRDLRSELVNHLSMNSDYYSRRIVISLIMNNIDIVEWLAKMLKDTTPLDAIGIYVLNNFLDIHTMVYRHHRLWSTLELSGPTEASLVANSKLLLI